MSRWHENREIENWLKTKGISVDGFRRGIRSMVDKEIKVEENKKVKRKKRNISNKDYQKRKRLKDAEEN